MELRDVDEALKASRPVRRQIMLLLQDGNVPYTAALLALSEAMLDIAIRCMGMEEQQARAFLASFFIQMQ